MQDEEDETEHLPLRLGATVVIPSHRKLKISRFSAGLWRPQAGQQNARARGVVPAECPEGRCAFSD